MTRSVRVLHRCSILSPTATLPQSHPSSHPLTTLGWWPRIPKIGRSIRRASWLSASYRAPIYAPGAFRSMLCFSLRSLLVERIIKLRLHAGHQPAAFRETQLFHGRLGLGWPGLGSLPIRCRRLDSAQISSHGRLLLISPRFSTLGKRLTHRANTIHLSSIYFSRADGRRADLAFEESTIFTRVSVSTTPMSASSTSG